MPSQAQLLDTKAILHLLRRTRAESTRKTCFLHYWSAFQGHFQQRNKDINTLRRAYQQTFARLQVELVEEGAKLLGQGSVWTKLLLLGHQILRPGQPLPEEAFGEHPYLDGELLCTLLASDDPILPEVMHDLFLPRFRAIAHQQIPQYEAVNSRETSGQTNNTAPLDESETQSLWHDTWITLQRTVREKTFGPPLTATVFTYTYRIYTNRLRDALRKKHNTPLTQDPTLLSLPFTAPAAPPKNDYWEAVSEKFQSLARYDFHNEKAFVHFLLNQLDDTCRSLLLRHHLDGAELASVALELKLPESGIRIRISRCRKKLRDLLNAQPTDHGQG